MSWSDNGERVSIKWNGAFRLSADEKDIEWVEDGASLTISDGILLASRVEIRSRGGKLERTFSKNGFRKDYEPEGRLFLAAALDKLIRHSGAFAKVRVERFLKQGGPDAVLAEISRLDDSSYVRRIYYSELLKQATPSDTLLDRVLQRAAKELRSDYDKATLFGLAADQPVVTDAHRVAIARAAKSIASDYDQQRTLIALLNTRPVSEPVAAAVLDAATGISSSYDRSNVLIALAERGGLTATTSALFMDLVGSMSGSYDKRRVLTAASASSQAPEVSREAMKVVATMSGTHDQAESLINLVQRGGLNDLSADQFFASATRISSSYDLSRVLRKVINQPAMSERILNGVLSTLPKVSGSHDRSTVLIELAGKARITGSARDLFLDATSGLSAYDETRTLAALVRAEGRR
jgi:hypothetical protein